MTVLSIVSRTHEAKHDSNVIATPKNPSAISDCVLHSFRQALSARRICEALFCRRDVPLYRFISKLRFQATLGWSLHT